MTSPIDPLSVPKAHAYQHQSHHQHTGGIEPHATPACRRSERVQTTRRAPMRITHHHVHGHAPSSKRPRPSSLAVATPAESRRRAWVLECRERLTELVARSSPHAAQELRRLRLSVLDLGNGDSYRFTDLRGTPLQGHEPGRPLGYRVVLNEREIGKLNDPSPRARIVIADAALEWLAQRTGEDVSAFRAQLDDLWPNDPLIARAARAARAPGQADAEAAPPAVELSTLPADEPASISQLAPEPERGPLDAVLGWLGNVLGRLTGVSRLAVNALALWAIASLLGATTLGGFLLVGFVALGISELLKNSSFAGAYDEGQGPLGGIHPPHVDLHHESTERAPATPDAGAS